jgi:hypothetical protein
VARELGALHRNAAIAVNFDPEAPPFFRWQCRHWLALHWFNERRVGGLLNWLGIHRFRAARGRLGFDV